MIGKGRNAVALVVVNPVVPKLGLELELLQVPPPAHAVLSVQAAPSLVPPEQAPGTAKNTL